MPMHRCPGSRRVVRRNRADNGGVVANGLLGKIGGMKVLLHPSPKFRPLIPKPVDHQLKRAVARCLGQPPPRIICRPAGSVDALHVVARLGGAPLD